MKSIKILKELINYLPSKILPALFGLITIPYLTSVLTPLEYGKFNFIISILSVLMATFLSWIPSIILRFTGGNKYIELKLVSKIIICSLLVAQIFWVVIIYSVDDEQNNYSNYVLCGSAWIFVILMIELLLAYNRSLNKVWTYSLISSLRAPSAIVGVLFTIYISNSKGHSVLEGIVIYLCFVCSLGVFLLLKKNYLSEMKISISTSEIVKYGFPLVISNILIILLSVFDRFVIKEILGEESLAIYSANYEFTEKIFFFINAWFTLATSKRIYDYYDNGNENEISKIVSNIMSLYIKIVLPIGFLYIQLLANLTQILFSNLYSDKSEIGIYVALSAIVIGLMHRYSIILSAMKRTIEIAKATAIAVIVNIISSIILVTNFGLIGAAWSTLLSSLVWLFMMRIYLINIKIPSFPWKIFINVCICIFFASIPIKYLIHFYRQEPTSLLLILSTILLYSTIYFITDKIILKIESYNLLRL